MMNDERQPSLLFVYNADSGLFNTLTDVAHKIFSPKTYQCNLCAITHSAIGMRDVWKLFIEDLGVPMEFVHRDEFRTRRGGEDAVLPAVFLQIADGLRVLIDAESINACRTIDDLMGLIRDRLKQA